ncbi:hypothetical protein [Bacillus sp. ISL-45]|uniref:hypothetical protein n=1 Tax=Bacillus sp. ISL-45 TaxID=2819128 RepID=UPI001BE5C270|nr:hypothetical protein [Bacillus sp. ISL-45]MBT2663257.1 hypothetical protein [Bacillus sp. ISL-45]
MITEIVSKYHSLSKNDPHHRYKSWEHCYSYFSNNRAKLHNEFVFDHASLHLAFYLASWGMLRGSSFLLQKDYKVHLYFLKNVVMNPVNEKYFNCIEKNIIEDRDIAGINNLIKETKRSYMENVKEINGEVTEINVTDTLASKILLGVYGNVPAYDRYFKDGLSLFGINTQFNESSLNELKTFYNENYLEFESLRVKFSHDGIEFTPMKLIDMYFWQVGFMMEQKGMFQQDIKRIAEFAQKYIIADCKDRNPSHQTRVSLNNTVKNPGTAEIREFIQSRLLIAMNEGKKSLDLRSGDIHKNMGLHNCMPSVCNAMVSIPGYKGVIIQDTPSGKSSTKVVRYMLKEPITV